METFFISHAYLMEHFHAPVRRSLMDSIDWSYRMIGIRGPRGVGRTSFLLQYAKENYDVRLRQCLYINVNSFYFQAHGIVDFAGRFVAEGGQVLLIDQVFKLQNWREQLCECYRLYPYLRIVYTTTSVSMGEEEDTTGLSSLSRTYVLHGFSFREYINLATQQSFEPYTFDKLLNEHEQILRTILPKVHPWNYFLDYLKHGYYPFFLENHNFTEALLKAMNNMIEVDLLLNKQIELKYLARIKKLLYLLAINDPTSPNVSKLATEIGTSRATVMNYLKYLEEARLINMVHREGEKFSKKPAAIYLHDANLMYAVYEPSMTEQTIMETFFVNCLWRHHTVHKARRAGLFRIDNTTNICVCDKTKRVRTAADTIYVKYNTDIGREKEIPLWLFGFLY
ncbi:MAG: AAA family ATPase [Alloprevotella sp.]|nr:ATP-binding protein [Prevotellamassilia sp.]MCI5507879.1 AAA family ATPase [Bacteroidales bacterium]MDY2975744.1 AAA family ATPase [Alloprevotella sp.]MCI6069767.1 AAA family ATPase [Bacteroidales bacterium]MDD6075515.1 AAA family ATPase [Bacteroidales bacterium]